MCGIVAYIGENQALPILISGLERLEYRGYDSAGVAVLNGGISIVKEKGKIANLKKKLEELGAARQSKIISSLRTGTMGIGHTRWATHGEPSQRNAHPHTDSGQEFVVVQNGIFENYAVLKAKLIKKGHHFVSATDTEVSAHLLKHFYRNDLVDAFRRTVGELKGYFALVAMSAKDPGQILAYKRSNPLIIGLGKDGNFVASDVSAILPYTKRVIYLEDEDLAVVTRENVEVISLKTGKRQMPKAETVSWDVNEAQKSGYPHFMLKEIYEQPAVVRNILKERIRNARVHFDSISSRQMKRFSDAEKVFFISCGTAYHAGMVGKYLFEDLAKLPAEVVTSSEFRYSDPIIGKKNLAIFISQSGETADTLAALKEAKKKGAATLAVVNVVGSGIAREADAVIYTHAGPEIGVASTKAYTAQILILTLLAVAFGQTRKMLVGARGVKILRELRHVAGLIEKVLKLRPRVRKTTIDIVHASHFLFLGRGYNFPSALEGALKLKEITYMHAHGYAAGEMKHGPIALVQNDLPVVCFAPNSKTHEKMLSNVEEIRARGGIVVAIGTEGDHELKRLSNYFFPVPRISEPLSPLICAIILQLFAYEMAVNKGTDVDHPRNLAKSVTVE